jgi:hypothetical protein
METLLLGTALALVALAFVLYPVFRTGAQGDAPPQRAGREPADAERAVDALGEVEFDRAAGTLSDDEHDALRSTPTAGAEPARRSEEPSPTEEQGRAEPDDAAEALIARYRETVVSCPTCGERPEPAAAFCSRCGKRLG